MCLSHSIVAALSQFSLCMRISELLQRRAHEYWTFRKLFPLIRVRIWDERMMTLDAPRLIS